MVVARLIELDMFGDMRFVILLVVDDAILLLMFVFLFFLENFGL
jgi:hypothetical protein